MISMASAVGRWPLISLRSIGHAERTTHRTIHRRRERHRIPLPAHRGQPARVTLGAHGDVHEHIYRLGTASVVNPICANALCTLSAQEAWPGAPNIR